MEIIAAILGLLFAVPSVILGCLELYERWGKKRTGLLGSSYSHERDHSKMR
jgi:hypothetical protein